MNWTRELKLSVHTAARPKSTTVDGLRRGKLFDVISVEENSSLASRNNPAGVEKFWIYGTIRVVER